MAFGSPLTFFIGVLLPEAPRYPRGYRGSDHMQCCTFLFSPPVTSPIKKPSPFPSTLGPVITLTLRKTYTATTQRQLTQGNIPLFQKSLQVTSSMSLIAHIMYPRTHPWLVTSAVSCCIPVTGTSSSSLPPAVFTDTFRHTSTVTE